MAIALVVIAAGFAGWTGWSWYHAEHSGSVAGAQVRDQVLREGQQAVQNFNTLDYRRLDQGLNLWESSSTGTLHSEIASGRAQFEQQIRKARTVTSATVLEAALTSLDQQAGTANIIVALQITVKPQAGLAYHQAVQAGGHAAANLVRLEAQHPRPGADRHHRAGQRAEHGPVGPEKEIHACHPRAGAVPFSRPRAFGFPARYALAASRVAASPRAARCRSPELRGPT